MKAIRVAIIDDGVNESFTVGVKLCEDYEIIENQICVRLSANAGKTSHGSICASILCQNACNYYLISIKILDENKKAGKEYLINALEWCFENNIELINLSIGSTNYNDFAEIEYIIEKLCHKGVIIVSACDNRGIKTYPACLPGVIGVGTDRLGVLAEGEYVYREKPYDGIDITAFSGFTVQYSNGETKRLSAANSYAAPYITALVCNYMSENDYSPESTREYLRANSIGKNIFTYEYVRKNMPLWKEKIEVPIIAVLYGDAYKRACSDITKQLMKCFRNDGYCCAGCTDNYELEDKEYLRNLEDYAGIMHLNWLSRLELFFNVELPDILFITAHETKLSELRKIHDRSGIDIIIFIEDAKRIQSMGKTAIPGEKFYNIKYEKSNFFRKKMFYEYNMDQIDHFYKIVRKHY